MVALAGTGPDTGDEKTVYFDNIYLLCRLL
jgi:hypothetical protein